MTQYRQRTMSLTLRNDNSSVKLLKFMNSVFNTACMEVFTSPVSSPILYHELAGANHPMAIRQDCPALAMNRPTTFMAEVPNVLSILARAPHRLVIVPDV